MVDWKGKENPLVEAVKEISITRGRKLTPEEQELEDMRGPVVAEDYRKDPRLNGEDERQAQAERVYTDDGVTYPAWLIEGDSVASRNNSGSYEALMGGWADAWGKKSFNTEAAT